MHAAILAAAPDDSDLDERHPKVARALHECGVRGRVHVGRFEPSYHAARAAPATDHRGDATHLASGGVLVFSDGADVGQASLATEESVVAQVGFADSLDPDRH
jgi:hypothetical protein